jgi:hypothetical protein
MIIQFLIDIYYAQGIFVSSDRQTPAPRAIFSIPEAVRRVHFFECDAFSVGYITSEQHIAPFDWETPARMPSLSSREFGNCVNCYEHTFFFCFHRVSANHKLETARSVL